jgi:hypothetical protein
MQKPLFVSLVGLVFLGAFGAARLFADIATTSMSGPTTFKQQDGAALFQKRSVRAATCRMDRVPLAQDLIPPWLTMRGWQRRRTP